MALKSQTKGLGKSRNKERLEAERFFVTVREQRRKDWVLLLVMVLAAMFGLVVLGQAFGYANLPSKPFYCIVVGLIGTVTYVVRAICKRG